MDLMDYLVYAAVAVLFTNGVLRMHEFLTERHAKNQLTGEQASAIMIGAALAFPVLIILGVYMMFKEIVIKIGGLMNDEDN